MSMTQSFIYSDILQQLGWFDPQSNFERLADVNYVHWINKAIKIDSKTVIGYFPGCFAEFHDGHVSVIESFVSMIKHFTDNYVVVIAPANTDYTVSKYGQDSLYATNRYRFDKIVEKLKDTKYNICIDLNPMLNNDRDFNFTDLVHDFVVRQLGSYDNLVMSNVPYILSGKDREYFTKLGLLTNKLQFFYCPDTTGLSSSNAIKDNPKPVVKKKVYLRCNELWEFTMFSATFHDHYSDIIPVYMKTEIGMAQRLKNETNAEVTICKEYKNILPYVPFHREFEHPLMTSNTYNGDIDKLRNKVVLDSDIYTGGTKRCLEMLGCKVVAVMDYTLQQDNIEIVDFADFYNDDYRYPFYDISTRCSMLPFTKEDHKTFLVFKQQIKRLCK